MPDLVDTCIKATGRVYPDGYGFALAFLKDDPTTGDLANIRHRANDIVDRVLDFAPADQALADDVAGYVNAWASTGDPGWRRWLIEAAQLVLQDALGGSTGSARVLKQWGHPGYQ